MFSLLATLASDHILSDRILSDQILIVAVVAVVPCSPDVV